MRKFLTIAVLIALPAFAAYGQTVPDLSVAGVPVNRTTLNSSASIASGSAFQVVMSAVTTDIRQELKIQNNNTNSDNCWIFFGTRTASKASSVILAPRDFYKQEWPFVPSDEIQATCTGTADTLYIETR